jgi:hypothetical protein
VHCISKSARILMFWTPLILAAPVCNASAQLAGAVTRRLVAGPPVPTPDDIETISNAYFGPGAVAIVLRGRTDVPLLYDATLARVQKLGRPGEGPGEFRSAAYPIWSGDSIGIYDNILRRISFFSHAGRYLSSISTGDWPQAFVPMVALGNGRWVAAKSHGEMLPDSLRLVIIGSNHAVEREIAAREQAPLVLRLNIGEFNLVTHQPIIRSAIASVVQATDEIIVASAPDEAPSGSVPITLNWISTSGEARAQRTVLAAGERVSAVLKAHLADSVADAVAKGLGRPGTVSSIRPGILAQFTFPTFVPPLRWARAGEPGAAWIEVAEPSGHASVCRLSRNSNETACAALPAGIRLLDVDSSGRLLLERFDADGIPSLGTARLQ